ncbi:hypothetical protein CPB84DRAFT_1950483 [Gymnopilus junonius]|uniref:Flavin-containing monooxygenase n=1 Tax=Gymnopilus junonius TaxID=109634 RepID=A0A9P5TJT7_GYMJU|nr:hypothetical protein CPB84DRAFT_1950483 [Gymnopilus junonius]
MVPSFSKVLQDGNVDGILSHLDTPLYWKDILALSWDIRTFKGTEKVKNFLSSQLGSAKCNPVQHFFPDLVWIQLLFKFETTVGLCSAPVWKVFSVFTNLEDLKYFLEKVGPLCNQEPNHGKWESARMEEIAFEGRNPTVLIIGGGQCVVDRNPKVGDNWRTRYKALCLHNTVWYNHLPYIPFPPSWPVYTPAIKLANWLEHYVEALELNVWTSSTVTSATQDPKTKVWSVTVTRSDGSQHVFEVKHVILAVGLLGGLLNMPKIPGMDTFKGKILHSLQHRKAADHAGKNRLWSENGPPTNIADRLSISMPMLMMAGVFHRLTKVIAKKDKELLDGLHKVGFRTTTGYKDCGFLLELFTSGGGYYPDVGGSQYLIYGKIKLKNDSQIKEFVEGGITFEDGSKLEVDVVVFCTGKVWA